MIRIAPVKQCPHTRKSIGIVNMTPELIAQLSAAVYDKDEWAIVLTGERKDSGYVIDVTDYVIPPQKRTSGNVEVEPLDTTHVNGCDVLEDGRKIVGVIHSHHSMGAFFSGTDVTKLNTRFPMSIVVAQGKSTYLGFDYLGTGKVTLPCGATGEIEFKIQPTVGPTVATLQKVIYNGKDLGDCPKSSNESSDEFHVHFTAPCGLSEPKALRANSFVKEDTLLKLVSEIPRPAPPPPRVQLPHTVDLTKKSGSAHQEQQTSWLSSLIPDRFKPFPKKEEERDDDYEMETYPCEVCGKKDIFYFYECGNCQDSYLCPVCEVGHDRKTGCPEARYYDPVVVTGA